MATTAKTLSDVPAINRFLSYCRVRTVPSKTVMIHAGDLPDILYYIVDGSVEVMIEDEGETIREWRCLEDVVLNGRHLNGAEREVLLTVGLSVHRATFTPASRNRGSGWFFSSSMAPVCSAWYTSLKAIFCGLAPMAMRAT